MPYGWIYWKNGHLQREGLGIRTALAWAFITQLINLHPGPPSVFIVDEAGAVREVVCSECYRRPA